MISAVLGERHALAREPERIAPRRHERADLVHAAQPWVEACTCARRLARAGASGSGTRTVVPSIGCSSSSRITVDSPAFRGELERDVDRLSLAYTRRELGAPRLDGEPSPADQVGHDEDDHHAVDEEEHRLAADHPREDPPEDGERHQDHARGRDAETPLERGPEPGRHRRARTRLRLPAHRHRRRWMPRPSAESPLRLRRCRPAPSPGSMMRSMTASTVSSRSWRRA